MDEEQIRALIRTSDNAINNEDFDKVAEFYSDDALLVVKPGLNITGKDKIRKAFDSIAEYFNHSLHVIQNDIVILVSGDSALAIAKAFLTANNKDGSTFELTRKATYVFRQIDDKWLCVIDNSYGTDILDINE